MSIVPIVHHTHRIQPIATVTVIMSITLIISNQSPRNHHNDVAQVGALSSENSALKLELVAKEKQLDAAGPSDGKPVAQPSVVGLARLSVAWRPTYRCSVQYSAASSFFLLSPLFLPSVRAAPLPLSARPSVLPSFRFRAHVSVRANPRCT